MTTYEYVLHPVSATEAARIPLPVGLTDAEKEAYAANPPAEAIAKAERWPIELPKEETTGSETAAPVPQPVEPFLGELTPDEEE